MSRHGPSIGERGRIPGPSPSLPELLGAVVLAVRVGAGYASVPVIGLRAALRAVDLHALALLVLRHGTLPSLGLRPRGRLIEECPAGCSRVAQRGGRRKGVTNRAACIQRAALHSIRRFSPRGREMHAIAAGRLEHEWAAPASPPTTAKHPRGSLEPASDILPSSIGTRADWRTTHHTTVKEIRKTTAGPREPPLGPALRMFCVTQARQRLNRLSFSATVLMKSSGDTSRGVVYAWSSENIFPA